MASTLKSGAVRIDGLDDLRRELKKLDDAGLIDALKDLNFEIASKVVQNAQRRASTRQQSSAAQSLKAGRQAAKSVVTGGGAKKPFFGGAEFGSIRFPQFPAWQGNGRDAGYFLFPAIRSMEDEIVEMYGDEVEKITARAFPD